MAEISFRGERRGACLLGEGGTRRQEVGPHSPERRQEVRGGGAFMRPTNSRSLAWLLFSRRSKFFRAQCSQLHATQSQSPHPPGAGTCFSAAALLRGNLRGISKSGGRVINSHFLEIASWSWVRGRDNQSCTCARFSGLKTREQTAFEF